MEIPNPKAPASGGQLDLNPACTLVFHPKKNRFHPPTWAVSVNKKNTSGEKRQKQNPPPGDGPPIFGVFFIGGAPGRGGGGSALRAPDPTSRTPPAAPGGLRSSGLRSACDTLPAWCWSLFQHGFNRKPKGTPPSSSHFFLGGRGGATRIDTPVFLEDMAPLGVWVPLAGKLDKFKAVGFGKPNGNQPFILGNVWCPCGKINNCPAVSHPKDQIRGLVLPPKR